mmetsp:Transcript_119509/g.373824  ORF Transcript_119509/g.373824 Transcript_119509/m.373824 type:complete len:219 (-) Transcript_119509:150-806(-)
MPRRRHERRRPRNRPGRRCAGVCSCLGSGPRGVCGLPGRHVRDIQRAVWLHRRWPVPRPHAQGHRYGRASQGALHPGRAWLCKRRARRCAGWLAGTSRLPLLPHVVHGRPADARELLPRCCGSPGRAERPGLRHGVWRGAELRELLRGLPAGGIGRGRQRQRLAGPARCLAAAEEVRTSCPRRPFLARLAQRRQLRLLASREQPRRREGEADPGGGAA